MYNKECYLKNTKSFSKESKIFRGSKLRELEFVCENKLYHYKVYHILSIPLPNAVPAVLRRCSV